MGYNGKYLNPDAKPAQKTKQNTAKKSRKGKKIGMILTVILVVLLVAAGVVGVMFYNSMINRVSRAEVEDKDYTMNEELQQMMGVMEEPGETEEVFQLPTEETAAEETEAETEPASTVDPNKKPDILNVLLVGQAAREGEEYRMADTMILVTINKDTSTVTLTSFLRDAYVKLPDYKGHVCGKNRINVCYHLGWTWGGTGGAMEMTNLCLKNNFGIEVDHNVEIDFNAFAKVIEILGGVRIDLTQAEADYLNEHKMDWQEEVTAGENRLFGDYALSYARMRKAEGDSDSDIKRTERQRKLLTAIFEKLKSKGMSAVQDMANEVLPMITTNMTNAQITSAMLDVLPMLKDLKIETGTCPVSKSYKGEVIELGGYPASVIKFDSTTNRRQMMMLTEGITEEEAAKIY